MSFPDTCDHCGIDVAPCTGSYSIRQGVEYRFCSDACKYAPERFEVGEGVSICYVSDVYPATVRRVSPSGHKVWVSKDRVTKADFDPSFGPRARLYEPRDVPETEWRCFTRRADGRYRAKGSKYGCHLSKGRYFNRPREI